MPTEVRPPALARVVEFAERPRTHDWSLRAALVRFAQPEPERVNALLDVVRRVEWALGRHGKLLEKQGEALWNAVESGDVPPSEPHTTVVELLRAARELDGLGDVLATWAVDRAGRRPDAEVDAVTAEVARRLDALGVPREERPSPGRSRG